MPGCEFPIARALAPFAFVCLLITCESDEDEVFRDYPVVVTSEVSGISADGATFGAEITHQGNQPIEEHGFVWGESSNLDERISFLVKLGPLTTNYFSFDIRSTLAEGKDMYVRAFLVTREKTIYGKAVSFRSLGSEGPIIESVAPLEVLYGDTVSIRGRNFNHQEAANVTVIGGVAATVVRSTDTLIVSIVPSSVRSAEMDVTVSIAGNTVKSQEKLHLLAPVLGNWSPESTVPCDSVEIDLANISPTQALKFTLQGSQLDYRYNPARRKLRFKVNMPLPLNTANVGIEHGMFRVSKQYAVSHAEPAIMSRDPAQPLPGDSVRFVWNNLNECVSLSAYIDNLQVNVPFTRKGNLVTIRLPDYCIPEAFNVGFNSSYGFFIENFNYSSDSFLTSSSPTSGIFGTTITVQGNDFIRDEPYTLYLGNSWVLDVEVLSDTQLRFQVPQTLTTEGGAVDIVAEGCLAKDTLKAAFSLPSPEILSISPGTVTDPSAVVTLSANYLSTLDDYTYVYIDNLPVPTHFLRMNVPVPGSLELDAQAFIELFGDEINQTSSITIEVGGIRSGPKLLAVDIRNPWELKLALYELQSAHMASFAIQGMGYATLGNPFNTALWQYTPSDDSWIEKASFPSAPRLHPVTFTTASAAYVGFGTDGAIAQQDLWKYDVVADSWSSVAAAPFNARQHAVHFTINGKGYYGGGTDDMGIPLTDFWEFNPSDESWVQKADIPLAGSFSYLPTFSLNDNRGYVLGEAGGLARFARYNPGTNTWALLSAERDCPDCSLAVINDQVLLSSFEANRIWLVKPSANQWKEIPFGGVTSGPAMFEINGLIYYGLGEYPGQGYSPQFWSFDINSVN